MVDSIILMSCGRLREFETLGTNPASSKCHYVCFAEVCKVFRKQS